MDLAIVIRDGLGVVVPALLSFMLLDSSPLRVAHFERRLAHILAFSSFRTVVVVPEEGDHLSVYFNSRCCYSVVYFVHISLVFSHYKRSGVHRPAQANGAVRLLLNYTLSNSALETNARLRLLVRH